MPPGSDLSVAQGIWRVEGDREVIIIYEAGFTEVLRPVISEDGLEMFVPELNDRLFVRQAAG
ncbi:MAG: hypothetical protein HC915_05160 [Anaerolineae bacterium]|nr:hypothetical protein [Anaerolineae bacterium]